MIPWEHLDVAQGAAALRELGVEARASSGGVTVRLGASPGSLACVVAQGAEGRAALDDLAALHPEAPLVGPRWSAHGVWRVLLRQGVSPVSSGELAPGVSLVAHGAVPTPPSVVEHVALRWVRGASPDLVAPGEVPSWCASSRAEMGARVLRGAVASDDGAWMETLATNAKGKVKTTFGNVCAILRHDERFESLVYNEMAVSPELNGEPVTDATAGTIREGLERRYGIEPGAETIAQALLTVASERSYHPVRRYLEGLEWDGVPRLDALAPEVLGAARTVEASMLRRWAISAVARALSPGCKVDTVLVLVGSQGARKSSFFAALARQWFTDSHVDLGSKDVYLQIARSWILEWGEVERVTARRGADEVKSFLSSRVDVYRPPYGRAIVHVPRSCVIVGSTNEDAFLSDPTGSRRFWVVRCERADIDVSRVERDRDQLWAEARAAYLAGEQWWLTDEETTDQQESAERFRVTDPWEAAIAEWVESAEGVITTRRILTAGIDLELSKATGREDQRVAATMRRLGWVRKVSRVNGVSTRVWERGS